MSKVNFHTGVDLFGPNEFSLGGVSVRLPNRYSTKSAPLGPETLDRSISSKIEESKNCRSPTRLVAVRVFVCLVNGVCIRYGL
jgi:hypothetical protein